MKNFAIKPAGDSALLLSWNLPVNENLNILIRQINKLIYNSNLSGVLATVPSYASILVYYDPFQLDYFRLSRLICELVNKENKSNTIKFSGRTIEIPVFYGGEYGPDLEYIAQRNNLLPEEVVGIHSDGLYYVYLIGFLPGFPYMGFVDPRISADRRKEPRLSVSSGSVGIAGRQTGVYSVASPGGWQIIGRTPVRLFIPDKDMFLFESGDRVVFKEVKKGVKFSDIDPYDWRDLIGKG